ncbi:MAG: hypothetical protein JNM94_12830 [Phycisphaerae bacterium]|nr:hypothetical protein [Phycisphaerae bacterium]
MTRTAALRSCVTAATVCVGLFASLVAPSLAMAGTQCVCYGDLTEDGVVDGSDIAALLASWGTAGNADLDGSGLVDGFDLGVLLAEWGPCTPPPNDTCSNAFDLGSDFGIGLYTCNVGAADGGAPLTLSCNGEPAVECHKDVWYSYTAPAAGVIVVTTCAALTNFDTVLAVYSSSGSSCICSPTSIGLPLACNDNDAGCGTSSTVTVPCSAGQCFFIRVGCPANDPGEFVIAVTLEQ